MADVMKQIRGKELPILWSALERCMLPIASVLPGASQIHGLFIE